ncbi:MAG: glycine zipper 2TM domain-containing protein [Desulfovibrionales bacterium]|nr:glycine zipper 2TM domain-containing protein [Desulfovibrionales bacterium]
MKKQHHNIILLIVLSITSALLFTGCASSRSGQVYSRDQARQEMRVNYGVVLSVIPVQIEGTQSGVGAVAGGVTGGVLGSMVGGGKGRVLGAVVGALGGAAGGAVAEEAITKKDGLEITVQMDGGEVLSVVQEADVPFYQGERVRLLRANDGSSRVQKQ